MALYETGTITGAANAVSVMGTGTKWSDAKFGINRHSLLIVLSESAFNIYQIQKIVSDTEITVTREIAKPFSNSIYGIMTAETASTASFANQVNAMLAYYQSQLNAWQSILTGKEEVTVLAPDGTEVIICLDDMVASSASKIAIKAAGEAKESATQAKSAKDSASASEKTASKSATDAKTSATAATKSSETATREAGRAKIEANRAKSEADRAEGAANEVDKQPRNPLLTAISALDTAADQMIYLTGKDKAAITALTELGRKLLAVENLEQFRAEIELGTAAQLNAGRELGNLAPIGISPLAHNDYNSDFFTIVDRNESFTVTGQWKNGPPGWDGSGGHATVYRRAFDTGPARILHFISCDSLGFGWHNWYLISNVFHGEWRHWWVKSLDSGNATAADIGAVSLDDAYTLLPVGIPQPWPGAKPPPGWLKCNGSTFNKALYPKLAAAYPTGKLPDLRGEFIRGWDDGRNQDPNRELLSWEGGAAHQHRHKVYLGQPVNVKAGDDFRVWQYSFYDHQFVDSAGLEQGYPRNIAFNYIVRAA